ncbi:MAG: hypothetical protein HQK59_18610, partial [Deltaproteobacteria bacterium]|nr:hypothetical protein [Deltaproteobacteria bacterium]
HVPQVEATGLLDEALKNYLALLGGSFVLRQEIMTTEELVTHFTIDKAGRSAAVFDLAKLTWMNGVHLRTLDPAALLALAEPFLIRAGFNPADYDREWLLQLIDTLRHNSETLIELADLSLVFKEEGVALTEEARTLLTQQPAQAVLKSLTQALDEQTQSDEIIFKELLSQTKKNSGASGKQLY